MTFGMLSLKPRRLESKSSTSSEEASSFTAKSTRWSTKLFSPGFARDERGHRPESESRADPRREPGDLPLPAELALGFVDLVIVYARVAAAHVPLVVELPVLVAGAAPPLAVLVVRLVLEAHRDAVVLVAPQLLHQPVVELALPLAPQEGDYLLAALEELVAVAPHGVLGVRLRNLLRVASVPAILRGLDLLAGGLFVKRGDGWSRHESVLLSILVYAANVQTFASRIKPSRSERRYNSLREGRSPHSECAFAHRGEGLRQGLETPLIPRGGGWGELRSPRPGPPPGDGQAGRERGARPDYPRRRGRLGLLDGGLPGAPPLDLSPSTPGYRERLRPDVGDSRGSTGSLRDHSPRQGRKRGPGARGEQLLR